MSERIEVGDLVMVVRWPCCGAGLGKTFTVEDFIGPKAWRCSVCKTSFGGVMTCAYSPGSTKVRNGGPIEWLKRIPPLREPAHHEEKETA